MTQETWDAFIGATLGIGAPMLALWAISSTSKRIETRIAKGTRLWMRVTAWVTNTRESLLAAIGNNPKFRVRNEA